MNISASKIANNKSGNGGAIFNSAGVVEILGGSLEGNSAAGAGSTAGGGAIYNQVGYGSATGGGDLEITGATISGNKAVTGGGGILVYSGSLTLTDSTLSANSAGALGGAIFNYNPGDQAYSKGTTATTTVVACTISSNDAASGGGIFNDDTLTIVNSTVARNSATAGGGIDNNAGTVAVAGTIVATNAAATGPDASGTFASSGNNLIGNDAGATGFVATTDKIGVDPHLGPLQENGGPTETMALLPGSPAIDAGTTADIPGTTTPITTDQRGFALDSPTPDIGAFQTQPGLVVNTTIDDSNSPSGDLSLRQAVNLANALGTAETITFDSTVFKKPQTITLTDGVLELSNTGGPQTITGPAAGLTVSGGGNSGVFQVDSGVTATIAGLSITDGNSATGGGILNEGDLTVTNCNLFGNSAALGLGGGVDSTGTLALNDSAVFGNSASYGGGIYSHGAMTVSNSTISGNTALYGGGVANYDTLTVTSSTLSSNSASNDGGGIFSYPSSEVTLTLAGTIVAIDTGPLGPMFLDPSPATVLTSSVRPTAAPAGSRPPT